jgi:hypothetical protein
MVCHDHEMTGLGKSMAQQVSKLEREVRSLIEATNTEAREGAAKRFRQKVERGDFALLFADRMEALLSEDKRGFQDELGALRVSMMRLLLEENDPTKLAMALSAVTNAQVRAAKAQEQLGDGPRSQEALRKAVTKVEEATRLLTWEEAQELDRREYARQMGWSEEQMLAWFDPVHQRHVTDKEVARRIKVMEEVGPGWQAVVDDPARVAAYGEWEWRGGKWVWTAGETARREDGETARGEADGREGGEAERGDERDVGDIWDESGGGDEAWSRVAELEGAPETWELPDLTALEGEELRETIETLAFGAPGAYREAMRRAAAADGKKGEE